MPPLPMPWNLPFQPDSGSHTSKLMAGVDNAGDAAEGGRV